MSFIYFVTTWLAMLFFYDPVLHVLIQSVFLDVFSDLELTLEILCPAGMRCGGLDGYGDFALHAYEELSTYHGGDPEFQFKQVGGDLVLQREAQGLLLDAVQGLDVPGLLVDGKGMDVLGDLVLPLVEFEFGDLGLLLEDTSLLCGFETELQAKQVSGDLLLQREVQGLLRDEVQGSDVPGLFGGEKGLDVLGGHVLPSVECEFGNLGFIFEKSSWFCGGDPELQAKQITRHDDNDDDAMRAALAVRTCSCQSCSSALAAVT